MRLLGAVALGLTLACAGPRALRVDGVARARIDGPAARRAHYQAAAQVMGREGYALLWPSEPDAFGVFHEPLRPEAGGPACRDVRIDVAYAAPDDEATLRFTPCLVERGAAEHAAAGIPVCTAQPVWHHPECIERAVARLEKAWHAEAAALLATRAVGTCPAPTVARAAPAER